MVRILVLLVVLALVPGLGYSKEICFDQLRCCVEVPDSDEYQVSHAAPDASYAEIVLKGGSLVKAESTENRKFMNLSVVKADVTDLHRDDFYAGYVYGSTKSKMDLGRLVLNKEVHKTDEVTVTAFEEIGLVNLIPYAAIHKIHLEGDFIYTLSVGKVSSEDSEPRHEPELMRFLDSLTVVE